MSWWLWTLAGAALAVLLVFGLITLMAVTNQPGVPDDQQRIAHEQFLAEQALQRQLQQTVTELFAAARRAQR